MIRPRPKSKDPKMTTITIEFKFLGFCRGFPFPGRPILFGFRNGFCKTCIAVVIGMFRNAATPLSFYKGLPAVIAAGG
ncbi:hypothetical protein D3OALGA1CA_4851 [Olavius algarvensis associated proteobacterium Delta 3]|nr:hypothetical protein D3OALGB2SA_706 [Olavius algarvensis associated proteobacterium Delta 3]CAB5157874.1 hypothetical protein D3OALGA1CA_4851 [Olavius algarvensis associated proteobacterium Delta 3]